MESSSTRHTALGADQAVASNLEHWPSWATRMCNICVSHDRVHRLATADAHANNFLVMALVWLFGRQIPLALLPFTVYSVFHVATYTRANLIPTFQPPQQSPAGSASPSGRATTISSPLADTIGRFVKEYYDASMMLVASLEIFLWFRVLGSAIIFTKGSWILLAIYTVFVRARYSQSSFVQGAIGQGVARVDALVANQSTPPAGRQAWETVKRLGQQATDATDINRYVGAKGQVPKKAQ